MTELEARVSQLERRAIRYRNALVVLVVGLCAVAVVGATTGDGVIRGRELVLYDDEGRLFALFGRNDLGSGGLVIYNEVGKAVVDLGYARRTGEGVLFLNSKDGGRRTMIGGDENGFFFSGANKTGETVVELHTSDYGNGFIGVWDRKGKGRTLAPGP